jgi:hypothetical protein
VSLLRFIKAAVRGVPHLPVWGLPVLQEREPPLLSFRLGELSGFNTADS